MIVGMKRRFYWLIGAWLFKKYGELVPDKPSGILVPPRWVEPHKRARIRFGLYEKQECALVNKYLKKNLDTIELGVGIGIVASKICRKLDEDVSYFGLEGNPELIEVAQSNIDRFRSSVSREVVHGIICGEYSDAKKKTFYITPGNFHNSSASQTVGDSIEIEAREYTLSDFLKIKNINQYQLVSDVEGAEYEILKSDSKSLENCKQIIIELHNVSLTDRSSINIRELSNKIVELGFIEVERLSEVYVFQK